MTNGAPPRKQYCSGIEVRTARIAHHNTKIDDTKPESINNAATVPAAADQKRG